MNIDLASLGWDAAFAAAAGTGGPAPCCRPGRVARVDQGVCIVLRADGPVRASLAGAVMVRAAGDLTSLPCVGDWVLLGSWPDQRVTVEAVLPRRTALPRPAAPPRPTVLPRPTVPPRPVPWPTGDEGRTGRVLAANIDAVAVVEPMHPAPDVGRVVRFLALAGESGALPLIVLAKCELSVEPESMVERFAQAAPGVRVLPVSALRGDGLVALRQLVAPGRTLALIGPAGAGKSALVNALAGTVVMPARGIHGMAGKGPRTTAYQALIPVPGGGAVLDIPGSGWWARSTASPA